MPLLRIPVALALGFATCGAAPFTPAPQQFEQEIVRRIVPDAGAPTGSVQLVDCGGNAVRAFSAGQWHELQGDTWQLNAELTPASETTFKFALGSGGAAQVSVPWREVRQLLRTGSACYVVTPAVIVEARDRGGVQVPMRLPADVRANQAALSAAGILHLASSKGLWKLQAGQWEAIEVRDSVGRIWSSAEVLGVAFDGKNRLWIATKAGAACQGPDGWTFYEGKDGLPWNDFTGITAAPNGDAWFTTHLGVIRFDGKDWHYRQGPGWLPSDDVFQGAVDAGGTAWFATAAGVGCIERRPMTLSEKAEIYEQEIERYIKRTPFGYVAEAPLRKPGDKSTAIPNDSDNDGLWTAMYGAGECFAYGATKDPKAAQRAKQAFEALRFLQKVTQGGEHSPPKGYVARTILPADGPDPNAGRLEADRQQQKHDKLWKAYEPRWPKSADGKWYWKSDTSSDELDGHYFFYPLYYDFCAETDAERERVREVVRDLTDHLVSHGFTLIDHDGKPTRWGVYGPQDLNRDPSWWLERGLKSLSMLAYLAIAEHVTGDAKYAQASRVLINRHGYAQNAMHPKVQHGPGSGNQSDDEMAFMCFYGLLRYSRDEPLKAQIRFSFYRYWINEAPELNPFFNFAYAAENMDGAYTTPFGTFPIRPWPGWHQDAIDTLRSFPLDRLGWSHRNSHRLDLRPLRPVASTDPEEPFSDRGRGYRVNGIVLPVENRHFNHWNTDPWRLDYGGNGSELAAGTVYLLPYYMGLYHGFIEKPGK